MPAGDRDWLDQHTRAMLAGLRDANPVVSLGHDALESLAKDDPEDAKAMLRSWLETYDTVVGSFEQADATDRALQQTRRCSIRWRSRKPEQRISSNGSTASEPVANCCVS